jgi:ankyrin repeat protein
MGLKTTTRIRPNGDTILHLAAQFGHPNIFDDFYRLSKSDQLAIKNDAGETPFMHACREGRLELIKHMHQNYEKFLLQPDAVSLDLWTGFMYACSNGFLNTIDFLAVAMQLPISTQDRFKRSALHWAARFNNFNVVQRLCELGIDCNLLD